MFENGRRDDSETRTRRELVKHVARQQWGQISGEQLRWLRIPKSQIDSWVRTGWLTVRYPGVYEVGPVPRTLQADFKAATLAMGPDSALSHISGGVLVGMTRIQQPWIDVTVPVRRASRDDIKPHFSRGFERIEVDGIPVKAPVELAIDLAECIRKDDQLLRALNQGLVGELHTWEALNEQLGRARGRHGVARIRRLLDHVTKTRSGLEDVAFKAAVCAGERPQTNVRIHGREVDQYDPETNTVTEIDSAKYHGNPIARYFDSIKQLFLESRGVTVNRRSEDDIAV